jgi:uncharacterized membrane protein YhhN
MTITLYIIAFSVLLLLVFEKLASKNQGRHSGTLLKMSASAKLLASCLFVFYFYDRIPSLYNPLLTTFSNLILVALVLSLLGDALLIPKSKSQYFLTGIATFAVAHLAFSLAFLQLPLDLIILLISATINLFAGYLVYRWLRPHLTSQYRLMVPSYLVIILVMVILGTSIGVTNQQYWLATGSLLFAISDIFVARNRFVQAGFINRLIGLPLYYIAQIMIAYGAIQVISLI